VCTAGSNELDLHQKREGFHHGEFHNPVLNEVYKPSTFHGPKEDTYGGYSFKQVSKAAFSEHNTELCVGT
jgi:hypothetical protein